MPTVATHTARRHRIRSLWTASLAAVVAVLVTASPLPARAQSAAALAEGSENDTSRPVLPAPKEHPPVLVGEVHSSLVFPFVDDGLCPSTADPTVCVFGQGGGVGGSIERRWPTGVALSLGYDAWFLEGSGLWEISVLQSLSASLRYLFLQDRLFHPYVAAGVAGTLIGDTFEVAAFGGGVRGEVGAEIELTETIALRLGSVWYVFLTNEFVTDNDGVSRGGVGGLNAAAAIQAGLVILESP